MDTLHDRLADLAEDAPTGGIPAAELWARGKRAHRFRVAGAAAALMAVGAVGTGIGVRLADGDGNRSDIEPAGTVGFQLPIEYPVGEELPDLGKAPGPLAAIWVTPHEGGGAPEVVGLVAETGAFGTLQIDLDVDVQNKAADLGVALSPDGRRIAYNPRNDGKGEPIVHDLLSGKAEVLAIGNRGLAVYDWMDATHLYGVASLPSGGWTDSSGWVWEPGTAPKVFNLMPSPEHPYLGYGWPYGGSDLTIGWQGGSSQSCSPPSLVDGYEQEWGVDVPVLCDVLGVVGSEVLLGHWKSEDESDGNGPVVALDIRDLVPDLPDCTYGQPCEISFDDPARRHVVVAAGAPHRVAFATDLIGAALDADGGAS